MARDGSIWQGVRPCGMGRAMWQRPWQISVGWAMWQCFNTSVKEVGGDMW